MEYHAYPNPALYGCTSKVQKTWFWCWFIFQNWYDLPSWRTSCLRKTHLNSQIWGDYQFGLVQTMWTGVDGRAKNLIAGLAKFIIYAMHVHVWEKPIWIVKFEVTINLDLCRLCRLEWMALNGRAKNLISGEAKFIIYAMHVMGTYVWILLYIKRGATFTTILQQIMSG